MTQKKGLKSEAFCTRQPGRAARWSCRALLRNQSMPTRCIRGEPPASCTHTPTVSTPGTLKFSQSLLCYGIAAFGVL